MFARRRSPLLWRILKAAAATGAVYLMVRHPDPEVRRRRRAVPDRSSLKATAERAMALKMRASKPWRPESRTANEGMRSVPNERVGPLGAL